MTKFHASGTECQAIVRACPLGESEHFASEQELAVWLITRDLGENEQVEEPESAEQAGDAWLEGFAALDPYARVVEVGAVLELPDEVKPGLIDRLSERDHLLARELAAFLTGEHVTAGEQLKFLTREELIDAYNDWTEYDSYSPLVFARFDAYPTKPESSPFEPYKSAIEQGYDAAWERGVDYVRCYYWPRLNQELPGLAWDAIDQIENHQSLELDDVYAAYAAQAGAEAVSAKEWLIQSPMVVLDYFEWAEHPYAEPDEDQEYHDVEELRIPEPKSDLMNSGIHRAARQARIERLSAG